MSIRADVVSLLTVTDLGTVLDGATRADWKRYDGTPLTVEEQEMVATATRQELLAGRSFFEHERHHAADEVADMDRLMEVTKPYFEQIGAGATFGSVWPLMTDAERAELTPILERMGEPA